MTTYCQSFRIFNQIPETTRFFSYLSFAGFLRRMLGLGEETSVGAPPPWACACTIVATGWVAPKVLLIGLATNPSAKTTPGRNKERLITRQRLRLLVMFSTRYTSYHYQVSPQTVAAAAAVWPQASAECPVSLWRQRCAGPALLSVQAECLEQQSVPAEFLGCWFVQRADRCGQPPSAACGSGGRWWPRPLLVVWAALNWELGEWLVENGHDVNKLVCFIYCLFQYYLVYILVFFKH